MIAQRIRSAIQITLTPAQTIIKTVTMVIAMFAIVFSPFCPVFRTAAVLSFLLSKVIDNTALFVIPYPQIICFIER